MRLNYSWTPQNYAFSTKMTIQKTHLIQFFLLLCFGLFSAVQSYAQTIIYLEARDDYSGESLKVEFRVESLENKHSYTIKNEDGLKYIEMPKNESLKIRATLEGYYVEERILNVGDITSSNFEYKVALQKRPTAKLLIKAISAENDKPVPASFDVFFEGRMIGRGNTTKSVNQYELVVRQDGLYSISTNSDGFKSQEKKINVEVGIPETLVNAEVILGKPAKEIAVKVIDEQSGAPVPSHIVIKKIEGDTELLNTDIPNGMTLFTFEDGINYDIEVSAENYGILSKSLYGSQIEDLTLRLRPETFVEFLITDSKTKRELNSEIIIESPTGESKPIEGNLFYPKEKGTYKFTASSSGYVNSTGTVTVNSLNSGRMLSSVELKEADKRFHITVIDHYSREVLENVEFRVFGPKGEPLKGVVQDEKKDWVFITDPKKEYFLEVSLDTFQDYTKMLSEDQKNMTVELYWAIPFTYNIKLIDKFLGNIVNAASLQVTDGKTGKDLFVYHDVANQSFKVKIGRNQPVAYSVVAKGYKDDIAGINTKEGNEVEILLERDDNGLITFFAEDYLTGKPLTPVFSYSFNDKRADLKEGPAKGQAMGDFNAAGTYKVQAKLNGYGTYNAIVKKEDLISDKYPIKLKKDSYTTSFKIVNFKDPADFQKVNLKVLAAEGKSVPQHFTAALVKYEAELQADAAYVVEVKAEGFENFSRAFTLNDLLSSNLEMTINLVEIPKPKQEVAKVEPPKKVEVPVKEEPKPEKVVLEKTKPAELNLEEEALKMPETVAAMAKEFSKPESVGKRYLLDEVYFDQSSAAIRDTEIKQLNDLVETMKANEKLVITIIGYTDNVGDPRRNLGLSKFRAKAVANYLFYKGADPKKIKSDGFGESKPVASNATEEERAKNRRVEMVLIEN